jgi:hypothetical protein
MASSSCLYANEFAGKGGPEAQKGEYPMLKIIAAIGVSSALMFAPAVALADESTTPPTPDTVKTPGNGPTIHKHHHHHHHHTKTKKPAMKAAPDAAAPADAPK